MNDPSSDFTLHQDNEVSFAEAAPGQLLVRSPREYSRVIEAGLSASTRCVLLYASNLPAAFFDLSSGQAGELLQKLQNYGMRVAIVDDGGMARSSRFGDMLAEARRRGILALTETRDEALSWIKRESPKS